MVNRRNLGEDSKLGGVVFGCTHETMDECLRNMIFGLPKSHWAYVYYIEPGLPIFLFNYHDRNLHGIFRAVSYGQLEINPHGAPVPRRAGSLLLPQMAGARLRVLTASLKPCLSPMQPGPTASTSRHGTPRKWRWRWAAVFHTCM